MKHRKRVGTLVYHHRIGDNRYDRKQERQKGSDQMSFEKARTIDICPVTMLYADAVIQGTWDACVMAGFTEQRTTAGSLC
jgi:hypothetical protein